jgi:hypothetical protein
MIIYHLLIFYGLKLGLAIAQLAPASPNSGQTSVSFAVVGSHYCGKIDGI